MSSQNLHEPAHSGESPLLAPREVRRRLNVSRATLDSWAASGVISFIRLPSGHRRYRLADVERLEQGAAS